MHKIRQDAISSSEQGNVEVAGEAPDEKNVTSTVESCEASTTGETTTTDEPPKKKRKKKKMGISLGHLEDGDVPF